jgi:hypothetical protein
MLARGGFGLLIWACRAHSAQSMSHCFGFHLFLPSATKRRKSTAVKKEHTTPGGALGPLQQPEHHDSLTAPSQATTGRRRTGEEENAAPSGQQTQAQEMGGNKRARGVLQEHDTNVPQVGAAMAGRRAGNCQRPCCLRKQFGFFSI